MTQWLEPIYGGLLRWLGGERLERSHVARYAEVFEAVTRFDCGREGAPGDPSASQEAFQAAFLAFVTIADAWARRQIVVPTLPRPPLVPLSRRVRERDSGLRRGAMRAPLDINAASARELAEVPGIGPSLARQIVARRESAGPFAGLGGLLPNLDDVKGWNPRFAYLACNVRRVIEPIAGPSGFVAYLGWLERGDGGRGDAARRTLRELDRLREAPPYWTPGRWVSTALWEARARDQTTFARLEQEGAAGRVAFVAGGGYLDLVTRLVRAATRTVEVALPRLWPRKSRRIRVLITQLVEARARGVEVRVVLSGRGRNLDALQTLAGTPIAVRTYPRGSFRSASREGDAPPPPTPELHESTVVIDGIHVVTGTLSWTPNALYRAIELATYVRSKRLASQLRERFDGLWDDAQAARSAVSAP